MFDDSVCRTVARDIERSRLHDAMMRDRTREARPMPNLPSVAVTLLAAPRDLVTRATRLGELLNFGLRTPDRALGGR